MRKGKINTFKYKNEREQKCVFCNYYWSYFVEGLYGTKW